MKAVVAAFNQEKALVGAFYVITNLRMELFGALLYTHSDNKHLCWAVAGPGPIRGIVLTTLFWDQESSNCLWIEDG